MRVACARPTGTAWTCLQLVCRKMHAVGGYPLAIPPIGVSISKGNYLYISRLGSFRFRSFVLYVNPNSYGVPDLYRNSDRTVSM